jgi:hypothetical protein
MGSVPIVKELIDGPMFFDTFLFPVINVGCEPIVAGLVTVRIKDHG